MAEPTVVSLFAGCGGSSLGYQMAGYRELLAVEWDDNAVATFRLNFPEVPVYHGDITALSVEECLSLAGLKPGELDVLDGSPPCQGFSMAGKRSMGDERNQLFREYCRLLKGLQPKAFIMENVSGMVKGKMRLIFPSVCQAFREVGYQVKAQLLNVKYFGVAQSRERLIFIGTRNDLPWPPSFPKPQSHLLTVREALRNVPPDPDAFQVPSGTKIYHAMKKVRPGRHESGHHSHQRLAWDAPATTQLANPIAGFYHVWHPAEHRVLTFKERLRLCGYPDEFQQQGSHQQKWSEIGNSVPPLFMKAIAEHVKTHILEKS